ncbi:hypothetical protein [Phenylobacterium sp.]|uniref:hypothetical protein n=1 Tax=Phenylobacterium sp. TaxID=1871053 RepID=UPI0035B20217
MSTAEQGARRRRRLPGRLVPLLAAALVVGFLIAFGARPVVFFSTAELDDALFIRLGQSLAEGRWLGPYTQSTLVKGMGFPVFLAIANLTGLPFVLALAAFHAACASFAAFVVARVLDSRLAGLALLALLLLFPTLYMGDQLRVIRDVFYASLSLALVASAMALATGRALPRPAAVALTGVLGAWWWLTREEGVWLVPTLALIALLPLVAGASRAKGWRPALTALAPSAAAALVAVALVAGVGAVNAAVYGRFVINEIKDDAFEGALSALHEVGAPYGRERVPVPAAAREQLYRVSPAFASLRGMDAPASAGWKTVGCDIDRRICGDIGGGWFFWAVRQAAAASGRHDSPDEAAAFYNQLEREVETACDRGQLRCKAWRVPLVPPMQPSQADDVARSAWNTTKVIFFPDGVWTQPLPSDFGAPDAEAQYDFLNRPRYAPSRTPRQVSGWFVRRGAEWFDITPGVGVRLESALRSSSPDLVAHFSDPALGQQRFALAADCPNGPCPAVLRLADGTSHPVDLNALGPGPHAFGGATLFVDAIGPQPAQPLLKTRFSQAWLDLVIRLSPLFRALAVLGVAAALVVVALAAIRRRITPAAILCVALAGAVAARILILALIDALSFPAANNVYALPAVPLLLMLCVVALHGVLTPAAGRLRRRRA